MEKELLTLPEHPSLYSVFSGGTGCSFLCFLCSMLSIIVYLFASFLFLRLMMASDNLCGKFSWKKNNSTVVLLKSHWYLYIRSHCATPILSINDIASTLRVSITRTSMYNAQWACWVNNKKKYKMHFSLVIEIKYELWEYNTACLLKLH